MQGLAVATLVGGVPVAENSRSLAGGCHVAVGTPGRVRFLMSKGLLRPWPAKTLVLDSADWLMAPIFQVCVGGVARALCVTCVDFDGFLLSYCYLRVF